MKRSYFLIFLSIIILIFIPLLTGISKPYKSSQTFEVMGTRLTITIKSSHPEDDIKVAYERVKQIEKLVNRFDPNSEISKINYFSTKNFKTGTQIKISKDTYNCIELASKTSDLTYGAFDITLRGNYKKIILNPEKSTITITKPGVTLNLDGKAKGYAVEEARKLLSNRGIKDGIIDTGSSIAVFNVPKKIGVRDPFKRDGIIKIITLNSWEALSTSGIYEQGLHIIDPKNGKRVNEIAGVTLIGKNAGILDGISTGICVMGARKGIEFAKKMDFPIIIITKNKEILRYKL